MFNEIMIRSTLNNVFIRAYKSNLRREETLKVFSSRTKYHRACLRHGKIRCFCVAHPSVAIVANLEHF